MGTKSHKNLILIISNGEVDEDLFVKFYLSFLTKPR